MSTRRFDATAAEVRRALDGVYEELDPGDALWRCTAGPFRTPVEVRIDDGPVVVASATVVPAPALTGAVARAILFEHDSLMFGRFVHADGEIRAEQRILGGHTMDGQEVRLAVWGVGWVAGAYRDRWQRHLAGEAVLDGDPVAGVAARRGAEQRVASTQSRVERFLRERYGSFTFDEAWGYHGPFGSTRVFVSVRHVLETTTVVLIASPVLSGVDAHRRARARRRRHHRRAPVRPVRVLRRSPRAVGRALADRRRPRSRGADGGDRRGRRPRRRRGRTASGRPRRPAVRRSDRRRLTRALRRCDQRRGRVAGPVQHVRRVDPEPEHDRHRQDGARCRPRTRRAPASASRPSRGGGRRARGRPAGSSRG